MPFLKFKPVEDKELRIKPEMSVGNAIVILLALLSAIGVAYSTITRVDNLEELSKSFASREVVSLMASDVAEVKVDLKDIKALIIMHLQADLSRSKIRGLGIQKLDPLAPEIMPQLRRYMDSLTTASTK